MQRDQHFVQRVVVGRGHHLLEEAMARGGGMGNRGRCEIVIDRSRLRLSVRIRVSVSVSVRVG